jgi:hypothetical protein
LKQIIERRIFLPLTTRTNTKFLNIFCRCSGWFFLSSFFLFIFFSCATRPTSESARTSVESFAAAETVVPSWQAVAQGIGFFHGKAGAPEFEFWALKIELSTPGLQIVVKGGAQDAAGGTNRTLSVKVSSFVSTNGLAAGINAAPFDISSSKEGQPIKNVGIVVSGGKQVAPPSPRYDALVFYKDGKAAIVNQAAIKSTENIENAVGGFHHILVNGEPAERTLTRENREPRSAAGISADGKYLYLLVIDGRREGSAGGTEKETALLLLALGSWNGLNLDGGGSSALALRGADGKVRVVNVPVHGGILGVERAVAGCLGIAAGGL